MPDTEYPAYRTTLNGRPLYSADGFEPNQINIRLDKYMAVFFWYRVKRYASSIRYCTVAYTGQVTFNKVPETRPRPLVTKCSI